MQLQHQMQLRIVLQHIVLMNLELLRWNITHVWETYIVFPGWRIGMQYFVLLSQ